MPVNTMRFSSNLINFLTIIPTLFVILSETSSSEVPRPRGVPLSRAPLYNPDKNFLCFDNSKTIPFSQVNDDYCDCPDASDEPGTSACPHGTFHCTNAGHKSVNLLSSRVNDGVCDCCDSSDEYNSRVTCPNNCLELGRHAREEAQRQAKLVKAGKQIKADISQKGVQLKQEKKDKLTELEKSREEAERVRNEQQALKNAIEEEENAALEHYRKLEEEEKKRKAEIEATKSREEAIETFGKFDSNQDGLVDLSELQTRQTFDKDRDGQVSEEEAKYFLNEQESLDLDKFISDAWPNIKPYLMMDAGMFKAPETQSEEAQDMQEEASETQEEEEVHDDEEEEEEEEEHQEPEPQIERSVYDAETQKLVDQATAARSEFAQADKIVRDIDSEIAQIRDYLSKDFGAEEEFATLQGQCFEYHDHEYIYKLCPFEKTVQQSKSGGAETRLGVWGRWAGPDDSIYDVMLYDKGQNCWNGPQRSSTVRVVCGVENKVTAVSEPNRCEYLFEFTTPAACSDAVASDNEDLHDEL